MIGIVPTRMTHVAWCSFTYSHAFRLCLTTQIKLRSNVIQALFNTVTIVPEPDSSTYCSTQNPFRLLILRKVNPPKEAF